MGYSIWLEFEHYADTDLKADDGCCNITVTYDDGKRQGYNVWTVDFFQECLPRLLAQEKEEGFASMPDFLVTKLERGHITAVLEQVLPTVTGTTKR